MEKEKSFWPKIILIGVLLIIVLVVGCFVYYYQVILSSKNMILNGFNSNLKAFSTITSPFDNKYELSDNLTASGNLKITGREKLNLNYGSIDFSLAVNKNESKALVTVDYNQNETSLLKALYYINTKENYLYSGQLYSKFIKLDDLKEDIFNSVSVADVKYLREKYYEAIQFNMDKLTYQRKIDNMNLVVTLSLTDKELQKLYYNINLKFIEDAKAKSILDSVLTAEDSNYMFDKESLEQKIKDLNSSADTGEMMIVTVKNNIISNKLLSLNVETKISDDTNKLVSKNYTFENTDGKYTMTYDDEQIIISDTSKGVTIEYYQETNLLYNVKQTKINDGTYRYEIKSQEFEDGAIVINLKKVTDSKTLVSYNVEASYQDVTASLNLSLENKASIEIKVNDYINYRELTEEDYQNIINKLMGIFETVQLPTTNI